MRHDDSSTRPLSGARVAALQTLLIVALLYVFLGGWYRDIRVPIAFFSDGLQALMQSKSTVDNGWWWFNPLLGAPFGFDELAFPANSNVDQAIVWLVSRVVPHALASINLTWAAMVVLSGLSATWCMRRLGLSASSAFVVGTLFALSPYALYRNLSHFWMVIYLVPFACTVALLLATGRMPERGRPWVCGGILAAGCALLGLNYVYYAFFSCFFVGLAAAVGAMTHKNWRILTAGVACVALISGFTVLNLAPSLHSWSVRGKPLIIRDKVPAEAEVYGLKIRHLVSPVFEHAFSPFRAWTSREAAARFPNETENMVSRLGVVGTAGFLGLLGLLFVPWVARWSDRPSTLIGSSQLSLAAVLLGTVGGFGSLVSLLVTPQIRAYNRIAPFIAFFSLVAVGLAIDALAKSRARRVGVATAVLMLGLGDQYFATSGISQDYVRDAAELPPLQAFVRELESRLPKNAMVLQLPFRTYLNDSGVARMQAYDHFKPYLVARQLRWSYPAMSNEQTQWQEAAAALEPGLLAAAVAAEGFAAILIDRYGYTDNGALVASAIERRIGLGHMLAQNDRYLALDVRSVANGLGGVPNLHERPKALTTGMAACGGPPLMALDAVGDTTAPLTGKTPHLSASGEAKVSGWAVDQVLGRTARGVDAVIGQKTFPTSYGVDRDDVAAYFKRPEYLGSGFAVSIPLNGTTTGPQTLSFRVVAGDSRCYYESVPIPIVIE